MRFLAFPPNKRRSNVALTSNVVLGIGEAIWGRIDVPPENLDRLSLVVRSLLSALKGAGEAMKKSRFTDEQIAYALRLAESGTPVADVCRQIGISDATFYTWKKKYADLGVSELRRIKPLEDENARLKRIVGNLTLDKQILPEAVRKKI